VEQNAKHGTGGSWARATANSMRPYDSELAKLYEAQGDAADAIVAHCRRRLEMP
jgi:hypothetical protein